MSTNRYNLDDGRIVLSPKPLAYAVRASGSIDLSKLTPTDFNQISIIADPILDDLLRTVEEIDADQERHEDSVAAHLNCCVLQEGQVYIRDKQYKPLTQFLNTASKNELRYALSQVARQAALLHREFATAPRV